MTNLLSLVVEKKKGLAEVHRYTYTISMLLYDVCINVRNESKLHV